VQLSTTSVLPVFASKRSAGAGAAQAAAPPNAPAWRAWRSGAEANTFAQQCADPSVGPGWEGEHCSPAFNLSTGALFRAPVMADPKDGPPPGFSTRTLYNERWCKYFENLIRGWGNVEGDAERGEIQVRQERLRLALGQFVCRTWNAKHRGTRFEMVRFNMNVYLEENVAPIEHLGERHNVTERSFWRHVC